MDYDKIMNEMFWEGTKLSTRTNRIRRYSNIRDYLLTRYSDTESTQESLRRIKNGIERRPTCPTCGKPVKYKGNHGMIFTKYCCLSCSARNKETTKKKEQTYLDRTGYTHNSRNPESQQRIKNTCQQRYGANSVVESYKGKEGRINSFGTNSYFATHQFKENMARIWNSEVVDKIKDACIRKYGVDAYFKSDEYKKKMKDIWSSDEWKRSYRERMREGCIAKYGVDSFPKSDEYKKKMKDIWSSDEWKRSYKERMREGCIAKYGVDSFSKSDEYKEMKDKILEKRYNTMKKNNSFNESKPEQELYLYIKEKFPSVTRQYKDKRYPWSCDFYIPELDLFLELNGTWTHGKHQYNSNSIKDNTILEQWKSKNTRYYDNAIKTWTISDVKKRETAKKNNLNFKEVWSLKEGKEFIDSLYEKRGNI